MELLEKQINQDTEEQIAFVEADIKKSYILKSTAGSGKTYVFVKRVKFLIDQKVSPDKILCFSFTNAAVDEFTNRLLKNGVPVKTKSNKEGVTATTIHSFCMSLLGKMGKFKKISDIYEFINWYKEKFKPFYASSQTAKDEFYEKVAEMYDDAQYIASEISAYKLQTAEKIKCKLPKYIKEYNQFMKETKTRDFSDMLIETHNLLKENKWLKMFKGKYDYIFVDEFQDTALIQLRILLSLNAKYYTLIGDINQCVVKGTKINTKRGLINVENLNENDEVLSSKGNGVLVFRKIKNLTIQNINEEVIKIITKNGKELITTKKHKHFANYSYHTEDDKNLFFVYLMYRKNFGFRLGITRYYNNKSSRGKSDNFGFQTRMNGGADKIWLLKVCNSEFDARYYEIFYSCEYQIPTVVFACRDDNSKIQNKDFIEKIFKTIPTFERGLKLLESFNYSFDISHYFPRSMKKDVKNINLVYCYDPDTKSGSHMLSFEFSNKDDFIKLKEIDLFSVRGNSKGTGWRINRYSKDINILNNVAEAIKNGSNSQIVELASLQKGAYLRVFPASYLLPGMSVYIYNENTNAIEYDIIHEVQKINYSDKVYDFEVEHTHNYIGNGIFTHNSIYGFQGANAQAIISGLKKRRECAEMTLSTNFRSKKAIVENSNKYSDLKAIAHTEEEGQVNNKIIGFEDMVGILRGNPEVAVLVRTNKVIRDIEKRLLMRKIPINYFNYLTPKECEDLKKAQERPSTSKKMKALLPVFGTADKLIEFIERSKCNKSMVTTVHKFKGLEKPVCIIVNCLSPEILQFNNLVLEKKLLKEVSFDPKDPEDFEAKNVFYVAITRPRDVIYYCLI